MVILVLGGALVVKSLVAPLALGMHDDEILNLSHYLAFGPSAIWGHYIANDHMLFEFLTWMLRVLTGLHGAVIDRLWSVVPAIASVAVLGWWLWRRLEPWVACAFVVLIAASPVFVNLSGEGRGYGLAFLAAALMLVGAESYARSQARRSLALFVVGAVVGIWTLPVFVLPVAGLAGVLLVIGKGRRDLLITLGLVAAASLMFYAPVLGDLTQASGQQYGRQLPPAGFITGPLREQLQPSVQTLLPGIAGRPSSPLTADVQANNIIGAPMVWNRITTPGIVGTAPATVFDVISAVLLAAGVIALTLRRERFLAAALLLPAIVSYLILEITGTFVTARFLSFLLAPLLILWAAGLVGAARLIARTAPLKMLMASCGVGFCVFVLYKADGVARVAAKPVDAYNVAAQVVTASGIKQVVSDDGWGVGNYVSREKITSLTPARLETMFCSASAPFVYVQHDLASRPPSTSCLSRRGAHRVAIDNRRAIPMAVWVVR